MALNPVAVRFGRNLVRCRKQVGLSQEALGVRATLHRTEVGLLERGERVPRIDTLIKVASALDVPPGDLVAGIGWEPGERSESTPGRFIRDHQSEDGLRARYEAGHS